jgi:creatinine amidohydrolase
VVVSDIVLERLTSPAVRAAVQQGFTTAVIACGATEQHGPHLPLFMDAEHGVALALEVATRLGNALVAPTIRVGCSDHHMAFPGTLTLRPETFKALCHDYAMSLSKHGFRHIYFIPTHGGNFAPLAEALSPIQQALGTRTTVVAFLDLDAQIRTWREVVEEHAGLGSHVGGHADIAEASIMLALHPALVRESDAAPGYLGELTPALLGRMFHEGIHAVSANGVLGDPRGMSETLGRKCIEATVDLLVAHFHSSSNRT